MLWDYKLWCGKCWEWVYVIEEQGYCICSKCNKVIWSYYDSKRGINKTDTTTST